MKIQGSRTPTRRATLVVPMLVCLLVVGCTGRSGSSASHPQQQPASAWPNPRLADRHTHPGGHGPGGP